MRRKLVYRPDALANLNETKSYTLLTWGDAQARGYAVALVADINALRVSALRYPLYDEVYPGLRRKRSWQHHIYYLAFKDRVEVLNVIHVQRDPGFHLKTESWPDRAEE